MAMSSSVPYLLRAVNEWVLDNGYTPYLVVDATIDDVDVPTEFVKEGQIVLNISPTAIRDLVMTNEHVMFNGRFAGIAREIYVPVRAVLGLVAKENGEGMWFPKEDVIAVDEDSVDEDSDSDSKSEPGKPQKSKKPKKKGPPNLTVIK